MPEELTLLDKIRIIINYNASFPIPIKYKWLSFITRTRGWIHIKHSVNICDNFGYQQMPTKVEEVHGWLV